MEPIILEAETIIVEELKRIETMNRTPCFIIRINLIPPKETP